MEAAEQKFSELKLVYDRTIKSYKQRIEAAKKIIGEDKPIVVKKPIPLAIVEKSEEEIMKENKIDFHNNVSSLFFGGGGEECTAEVQHGGLAACVSLGHQFIQAS